ncbi:MAG: TonB family protein [Solimonas sp.]
MTTDAVLVRPRLQHVPPAAVALAILLHALVGSALWWISPLKAHEPEDEPVMVTFDSAPSDRGLQAPERPGPPAEQQQALASPSPATPTRPEESPPSLPIFEFSVPPATEPPPPPTTRDFVRPPQPVRPAQRAQPQPRRPPAQQRPPSDLPAIMPSPMPGPDPGDVAIGQGRQRNDYLSKVFRHLEPYRLDATARNTRQFGRVVTRVTLTRDGRIIDVRLDTSSGRPALDAAEIAAIRKASPFPPVPASMPGDPVILVLPITY